MDLKAWQGGLSLEEDKRNVSGPIVEQHSPYFNFFFSYSVTHSTFVVKKFSIQAEILTHMVEKLVDAGIVYYEFRKHDPFYGIKQVTYHNSSIIRLLS